ncbi:MAG: short chain dehydrogenase [Chloroflexi bacterium]|nr:MAG: short chain dehydrogenase [Chloroflexota bacterium]RLC95420.1 MAG: short chain dehydrogenase [Chloroflexota bacterium]
MQQGRVALVTGAASGIGRATALAFAREAAKVVVVDILADEGEETVSLIKEAGGEAIFVKCDVARSAEAAAAIEAAVSTYGALDCAFNNAGIEGRMALTPDFEEEEWDRIINTNLKGVWLCLKYEIPQMLKQGGGVIVNTASVGGVVGLQGLSPYCASKGGVVQLTRAVALEYAQSNIRVNAVCPGGIRTAMSRRLAKQPQMGKTLPAPMHRWASPDEVAAAVIWLCSDASSFVTGHCMAVDGGFLAQ